MPQCEYEIRSEGRTSAGFSKMKICGKEGVNILLPASARVKKYLKNRKSICLCKEHAEFVFDVIALPQETKIKE